MPTERHRRPWAEPLEPRTLLSAELLADVNLESRHSHPGWYVQFKDALYFSAFGPFGDELYRTGGPGTGAELVVDLVPGAENSYPSNLTVSGDTLFFTATIDNVIQLWKSDGTAAGTVKVADVIPSSGAGVFEIEAFGGGVLFTTSNGLLWKSDGTPAGTSVLIDPLPTYYGYDIGGLRAFGDAVYFTTISFDREPSRLWKTDGTPGGTTIVREFGVRTLANSFAPYGLTPLDGGRFVLAVGAPVVDPGATVELYVSDGTTAGTVPLASFNPGRTAAGAPYYFVNVDGTVYFSAEGPDTGAGRLGAELWKTDGTPQGTVLVADVNPGFAGSNPVPQAGMNGQLLFHATGPEGSPGGLWMTDGTAGGTRRLLPGAMTGHGAAASAGKLFFSSNNRLWVTDGTEAGTVALRSFAGANTLGTPTPFRDGVVVSGDDSLYGEEPWFSDGTPQGTVLLRDIEDRSSGMFNGGAPLPEPLPLGDRTLFAGGDAAGVSLWLTDGTPGGTSKVPGFLVKSVTAIKPGHDANGPFAYVFATGLTAPRETWRVGAGGAATYLGPVGYAGGAAAGSVTTANGHLYFAGQRSGTGVELFKSDGTPAGTVLVLDIASGGAFSSFPSDFAAAGNTVYFTINDGASLWKTNGTAAGTVSLKQLSVSPGGRSYAATAAVNNTLFFTVNRLDGQPQLWKTDGTTAGTVVVKQLGYIPAGYEPRQELLASGGTLYFAASAADGATGTELWKSDGTAAGTVMVKDVVPGTGSAAPLDLRPMGGRVYFSAATSTGRDLWSSDGTDAGTVRVWQAPPAAGGGTAGTVSRVWGESNGRMYFTADDGRHGPELWSTDGSPGGTAMVEDVRRGPGGSDALSPVKAGGRVVFFASDERHGFEPRVVLSPLPSAWVAGRHVFYNNSAFDGGTPGANAADDAAIIPGRRVLLPDAGGATSAHVSNYSRGINGVIIDVDGLTPGAGPSPSDFALAVSNGATWSAGPAPLSVSVRRGAGANGSDRVTLVFADNVMQNRWLRVTVLPTAGTGLASPDAFVFGNLIGETNGDGRVDAHDLNAVRRAMAGGAAPAASPYDFDRNGRVDARDLATVRRFQHQVLSMNVPTPPRPAAPIYVAGAPSTSRVRIPARRSTLLAAEPPCPLS